MDPRLRKLRLALCILGLGTLVAWAWHGWQGWGLGRGYPDNGYLYLHQSAFTDWTGVVQCSALPTPYAHEFAFYFPATYFLFQPFVWTDMAVAKDIWPDSSPSLILYLTAAVLGTIFLQRYVLAEIVPDRVRRLLATIILTLGSYAVVFSFDRANVELGMALLVGAALLYCRQARFGLAALLISIPILLKLYPVVLLALFIRRRHLRYVALPAVGCFTLSMLALFTFSRPVSECLALWRHNLVEYNSLYMIGDRGLSGCASPWNALKVALLTGDHFGFLDLHLISRGTPDQWSPFFIPLARIYNDVFLALLFGLVLFATFVEREFFRRAILFLLFMTVCAQAGADYKLLWVHVALLVTILLPKLRRLDFTVVALMALILVPKKEIFFSYLSPTDTTYRDVSIGVVIDPLLILAAIALVLTDSWRQRIPGWSLQRAKGLAHQMINWIPWRAAWRVEERFREHTLKSSKTPPTF